MEGFTKLPKMQCFKEGGSVQKKIENYEKRERKTEEKADLAQDKAIVKKAIRMHDVQEHKGEKTDLSKLRNGGRAKKDCGTVKKYKAGGSVTNVYEAKKASGDKDAIKKVKQIKPAKAAAESAPVGKAKNTAAKFCGGGMAKYQVGGSVDVKNPQALTDRIAQEENAQDRELVMGPLRSLKNMAVKGYNKLTGQGTVTDKEREMVGGAARAPSAPVNQSTGSNINRRTGGKVCK